MTRSTDEAIRELIGACVALTRLGRSRDLNGDDNFHDAMRQVTFAAEYLGIPPLALDIMAKERMDHDMRMAVRR